MTIVLRAASVADAEVVLGLMHAAFGEYRDVLRPGSGALRESLDDVRAALAAGGGFLAQVGDVVAGSARHRVIDDYLYADRVAVLPAFRGRGIAQALMAAIERLAAERGIREVRIGVRAMLPSNLRFYENLGYRASAARLYPEGTDVSITLAKPIARPDTAS
jgi:GNAT superfamily N-acetyltransferase